MDRPQPYFIFDRDGTDHPWEQPLRELAVGPDEKRRAVAENWQMDHRVPNAREEQDLLEFKPFTAGRGGEEWLRALYVYHRDCICQSSDAASESRSAYLKAWNDSNRIHGVAPKDRLCHVGSIRSIVSHVLRGKHAADATAQLASIVRAPLEKVDQLAEDLARCDEAKVRASARILLDALGPEEPPWWACFAEEILEQIEAGSATGLCETLGLGHLTNPDWLLVWHYPVAAAGPLYRPTVAEASVSPFHYPSPPDIGFGITMHLNPTLRGAEKKACLEVLHRPLRGPAAETWCTGKLLPLKNFPEIEDNLVKELRRLHREKLRSVYRSETQQAWLDRHTQP